MIVANKEAVYDEQIHHLMAQIIKICQANGIAMIASFDIPNDKDADLRVTTILPDESNKNGVGHSKCLSILKPASQFLAMTIAGGDQ